jgi:ribosomal protein S18 acetylase RimI-like enzyme
MNIRQLQEADYETIIEAIDGWFHGRQMSHLLPRIFFIHFRPTSFAIEEDGRVIGFLAGFVSQTYPDQAYIHFVGIEANYRSRGLGHQLYSTFFETVRRMGCTTVRCITSPVNSGSIAFHTRMGFRIEGSNGERHSVPCTINYELKGADRVLFVKTLC